MEVGQGQLVAGFLQDIYQCIPPSEGTGWEKLDGLLIWISSGAAGEVWGTNKEGDVWRREGMSTSNPTGTAWKKVSSGSMKQVSIWGGQAWAVNNKDQILTKSEDKSLIIGKEKEMNI